MNYSPVYFDERIAELIPIVNLLAAQLLEFC